jgi:hypothetical protein
MVGKLEARMNGFYRVNINAVKMKKFHDGILFLESGMRMPVHKFGNDEIQVGEQVFSVNNISSKPTQNLPSTSSLDSSQPPANPIQPSVNPSQPSATTQPSTSGRNTRNSNKIGKQHKPIKVAAGRPKKKARMTPYARSKNNYDHSDANDEFEDMDDVQSVSSADGSAPI